MRNNINCFGLTYVHNFSDSACIISTVSLLASYQYILLKATLRIKGTHTVSQEPKCDKSEASNLLLKPGIL